MGGDKGNGENAFLKKSAVELCGTGINPACLTDLGKNEPFKKWNFPNCFHQPGGRKGRFSTGFIVLHKSLWEAKIWKFYPNDSGNQLLTVPAAKHNA